MIRINDIMKAPQGWETDEAVIIIKSANVTINKYYNFNTVEDEIMNESHSSLQVGYSIYKSALDYLDGHSNFQPKEFPYSFSFPYIEGDSTTLEAIELLLINKLIDQDFDAEILSEGE